MTSNVQCLSGTASDVISLGGFPISTTASDSPVTIRPPRPPKGTRWGGRAKGTPNKVNQSIREAIQMAFQQVGGVEYLVAAEKAFKYLSGNDLQLNDGMSFAL